MLQTLAISGYRSVRDLVLPLAPLTVVTGANAVGKSNVYRALKLISELGHDGAIASLAREGGLASATWAGPEAGSRPRGAEPARAAQGTRRRQAVALKLGFATDGYGYTVDLGMPPPDMDPRDPTMFGQDPIIKTESVFFGPVLRPGTLAVKRNGPLVQVRDSAQLHDARIRLADWESVLSLVDSSTAPEVGQLRRELQGWRFYDALRTDAQAPARQEQVGTRTPVLASDGADVAAAIRTIVEQSDPAPFRQAIARAFDGSEVRITGSEAGRFSLQLKQPGLLRALSAAELSDGTLRYLLLATALLSPRPAPLLVLNEPENSLHPQLLEPLGELIAQASGRSQIVVVSHSSHLVAALEAHGALRHELVKESGETVLQDQGVFDRPAWAWPRR
ncbi:AAA family ATPase [Glutamicibacter sp. MNS18]|uniref:AAA family ATPase n=1 Tax=Glutamicibacter sp. MNS18 TaxID=2989817 RepID=UPI0022364A19|nr:AAA family ATPase [Glutamicibacter sp. MNS18]MCW4467040.1 AAA family ATPase [Glutamicibacter sp. MNS18]